jgi:hypothetical protein
MKLTHEFEELSPEKWPQDPHMDGSGLRFEHGTWRAVSRCDAPGHQGDRCRGAFLRLRSGHRQREGRKQQTIYLGAVNAIPLTADRRRALELLTNTGPLGVTEAALLANGVTANVIAELEHDGFVTSSTHEVLAGAKTIDVKRYRITDTGARRGTEVVLSCTVITDANAFTSRFNRHEAGPCQATRRDSEP